MTIVRSLIALAFAAGAAPLLAEDTGTTVVKDPANERLVCRTQAETGSRLSKKKICMTVSEWRELSFRQGQSIDKRTAELPKPGA